jgi:hypothetical protein
MAYRLESLHATSRMARVQATDLPTPNPRAQQPMRAEKIDAMAVASITGYLTDDPHPKTAEQHLEG